MSKITAKLIAKGLRKGAPVIVECIEYDGEDDDKRRVKVMKNGKEDFLTNLLFKYHVGCRYADGTKAPCCYNPAENTAAAYWLVLGEYFDEPPQITTEGDVLPVEYTIEERRQIRF